MKEMIAAKQSHWYEALGWNNVTRQATFLTRSTFIISKIHVFYTFFLQFIYKTNCHALSFGPHLQFIPILF